jgi:sterol desaturase/sphingolipid hydroxylase (fatty acid hydroxylase superfamily)
MNSAFYAMPVVIAALFALEHRFPLRPAKTRLADRLRVNVGLGALALFTSLLVVKPIASAAWDMESRYPFGILTIVPMPVIVGGVLTFLLLDLTFYYWHRVNHTVPILWRLHVVHHIDPDLDVTTAYRFHVLEIALSAGFRGLQVLLIGGPVWAAIAYEVAFQLNTAFQHSNIRLPIRVERWMNLVIVTPRMHGIHHSKMKHETNANWSSVFSFWDRLHGTLQLNIPRAQIDIGIAGYARPADNRFWRALIMPFEPQRDYWPDSVKSTVGNAPTRGGTQP